jgi:hypothetical protein
MLPILPCKVEVHMVRAMVAASTRSPVHTAAAPLFLTQPVLTGQLHLLANSQVSTALVLSHLSRVVTLLQLQRQVFTTQLDLTILHLIHNRTVSLEIYTIFLIFIYVFLLRTGTKCGSSTKSAVQADGKSVGASRLE